MIANRNWQGFGLIEVLFCLLILSFSIPAQVKIQLRVLKDSEYAIKSQQALNIAESKLENLSYIVTAQGNSQADTYSASVSDGDEHVDVDGYRYRVEWQVTEYWSAYRLNKVEVIVSWVDRKGLRQQIKLMTLISS